MGNKAEGLISKFKVDRLTSSSRGIDHSECRYFVLDPLHDPMAAEALMHYAYLARNSGSVALADDLDEWVNSIDGSEWAE
jgi:hypothetical protein